MSINRAHCNDVDTLSNNIFLLYLSQLGTFCGNFQGDREWKGYHLVNWKALTVGKRYGGLGIKNLKLSRAQRKKWLWKLTTDNLLLWGKISKQNMRKTFLKRLLQLWGELVDIHQKLVE